MPDFTALVSLDGSKLAEAPLSLLPFAKSLGVTTVRLVSVWETDWTGAEGEDASPEMQEAAKKGHGYFDTYLKARAEEIQALGLRAEIEVRAGKAAEELLSIANDSAIDLIMIATHGRSGVTRWRIGSVADKVIRAASCPALVVGPNVGAELAAFSVKRICVPLDGSDMAEESLPVAAYIAGKVGADIDLIRVVQPPAMAADPMMGAYPVNLIETLTDAAEAYLQRVATELKAPGTKRTAVLAGPSAEEILRYLDAEPAQLVVVTSHGRHGIARWALGSVADRLLHGPAPVLVLRPSVDGVTSRLVAAATAG